MKITVQNTTGEIIYLQIFTDTRLLPKVLSHLMSQAPGRSFKTTVEANGNQMPFDSAQVDLRNLVGMLNDIQVKTKTAAKPVAT